MQYRISGSPVPHIGAGGTGYRTTLKEKKYTNCVLRRAGNNITEITKIQGKHCNFTGNLGGLDTTQPGVCYQNAFMSKCTKNINFTYLVTVLSLPNGYKGAIRF